MKVFEGGFGKKTEEGPAYHMGSHLNEVVSLDKIREQAEGTFFLYVTDGETSTIYTSADDAAQTLLCIETAKFLLFNQMYNAPEEDEYE